MQPLFEVSASRPWHWGIAILSSPGAQVPDNLDEGLVTGTDDCLVVRVRHAQDTEAERFEGEWDWATATIRVRSLVSFEGGSEDPIFTGVLHLPGGLLAIGDADSEVVLNDLDEHTEVRLFATGDTSGGATDVRVDLAPPAP